MKMLQTLLGYQIFDSRLGMLRRNVVENDSAYCSFEICMTFASFDVLSVKIFWGECPVPIVRRASETTITYSCGILLVYLHQIYGKGMTLLIHKRLIDVFSCRLRLAPVLIACNSAS